MKKLLKLLILSFAYTMFSTIVQAQIRIDSTQLIGATTDSLVFIVHSSIDSEIMEHSVEYEEVSDNLKINVLYSAGLDIDCYCPVQATIKIKKGIYQKAIVSLMIRYPIGGTEENPEYSEYLLKDLKEIDLLHITNIDNFPILSNIVFSPNPVQDAFQINLGESNVENLEIYNIQGSLLLSKNITYDKKIDVSFLSSGLYLVFVDRKYISKIMKK